MEQNVNPAEKSAEYQKAYLEAMSILERGEDFTLVNASNNAFQAYNNAERDFKKKKNEPPADMPVLEPAKEDECLKLYDPCTREPIADLSALEKKLNQLKRKQAIILNSRIELPKEIVTRLDLLTFILNRGQEPDISLLQYKRAEQQGQIFEAYWDIIFALGLVNKYPLNENYYMYNGNIDGIRSMDDTKLINQPLIYLQSRNVNMGASGASDITFVYKHNEETIISDPCSHTTLNIERKPKFIFCSSKFYKNDKQKSVDKYDIQNIYTSAKNLHQDYDYDIVLLVQNPSAVKEKIKTAIRQYISEEASEVFGADDLINFLRKFYDFIHQKNSEKKQITKELLAELLNLKKPIKPILNLRLHQEIAVKKIVKSIELFKASPIKNNKFLVGILPRGGKTYIAGGIVRDLKPKRVVVLLGAKSETLEQFKRDLFEFFQDFSEYTIIDVKDETTEFEIDLAIRYIFIMSVELYKQENSRRKLLIDLKSEGLTKADLFICDEAHLKQVTARANIEMRKGTEIQEEKELQIVDSIISKSVPVVYMTGTYMRPLSAFKIPPENVVIWDYEDLQNGKKLTENDSYFRELYGELYTNTLSKLFSYGETLESISSVYKRFPDLHLLTTEFTPAAKVAFSDQGAGKGFSTIEQLFRLKKGFTIKGTEPITWANGFQNLNGIMRLVNYLSPQATAIKLVDGSPIEDVGSVIQSIDKISQRLGDRLAYLSTDFVVHSQIWFLAHSQTDLLENRMPALASAIFRSKWFRKNFHILAVSGVKWKELLGTTRVQIPATDDPQSIGTLIFSCPNDKQSLKQCILNEEAEARKKNKGLIILAQNMLQVGISLPCADVVVLLDSGENVDERVQKMFRALTESPMKKAGYIVDLNYFRTVKAIMDYEISSFKVKKNKRVVSRQDSVQLFNKFMDLYYIDDDKPIFRENIQATIPEIQSLIEREGVGNMKIENAGRIVNQNVRNTLLSEFDKIYEDFLAAVQAEKDKKKLLRNEGKNVTIATNESESENNDNSTKNEDPEIPKIFNNAIAESNKKEAFIDIFKTILKLGIFTTDKPTIKELQDFIHDNVEFREIIYETLINRGDIKVPESDEEIEIQKKLLFDFIILPNLEKMVSKGREASYANMKIHFNRDENMQGRIDNVLKYINEHLAPKDKERHKFGEVFTPLTLVDEMLSKLPKELWSNPDLKWLDPANGMGNFPIKAFLGQDEGDYKYPGLFEGLKDKIKDDDKRCKHIVENMLYMIDINGKNNRVARMLFEKLCPGAKANIEQIDRKNGFLADKPLIFNGKTVDNFDIIMGNPPFNKGTILRKQTRKVKEYIKEQGLEDTKRESLWTKFILHIFNKNILKENGYLLFISPINWFHPETTGVRDILLSKQIHFLRIYFLEQSKRLFGGKGELTTAYYLVENKPVYKNTTIIDMLNNIDSIKLSNKSIIILAFNSIYNKITEKATLFKDGTSLRSTTVKGCISGSYKQILGIYEDGFIKYVKTNIKHPLQDIPKFIINGYTYPRYYFDKNGEYGKYPKDGTNFIIIGENLEKIKDYFDTKLSALLLNYIKFTQKKIDPAYYPDIRELPLEKITDKSLSDYFGFSKEEQDAINKTEYPKREYKLKEITCAELKKDTPPAEGGAILKPRFNKTRKNRRT